jgi:hypothetical protein
MRVLTEDVRRSSDCTVYYESVEIDGTVRSGARLAVHGDLTVHGDVEDAIVEAKGNVRIAGGFLGTGAGTVASGGNFSARFVQCQRIEAKGNVEVVKAIISGKVFASGCVRTGKQDGAIIGGEIHAGGSVEAAVLGSKRPVQTKIEVGVDPVLALRIEDLEGEAMELTRKRIGFLKDMAVIEATSCDGGTTDSVLDFRTVADAMQADILAAVEDIVEIRKQLVLDTRAFVRAGKASYPPLEISICFSKLIHDSETGPVVFRRLEDRIILDRWNMD